MVLTGLCQLIHFFTYLPFKMIKHLICNWQKELNVCFGHGGGGVLSGGVSEKTSVDGEKKIL